MYIHTYRERGREIDIDRYTTNNNHHHHDNNNNNNNSNSSSMEDGLLARIRPAAAEDLHRGKAEL